MHGPPRYGQQDCFPQPFIRQPQGMNNPSWNATAQFVNRAKQTALQQSGNHQLAALFSNNPGGYNNNNMGYNGGNGENSSSDGFMRPPFPSVRMGGPNQGQQYGRNSGGCNCPNCSAANAGSGNSFQPTMPGPMMGPGPMVGPQQNDNGRGNAVMTFTSQLTGLPIPEHPSGLFPNIDFVMVPANGENSGECGCCCGQQQNPMMTFMGGSSQQQPMNGWNGNNGNSKNGGNYCFGGNGMQMNSLF